jgi:hypothetical protein
MPFGFGGGEMDSPLGLKHREEHARTTSSRACSKSMFSCAATGTITTSVVDWQIGSHTTPADRVECSDLNSRCESVEVVGDEEREVEEMRRGTPHRYGSGEEGLLRKPLCLFVPTLANHCALRLKVVGRYHGSCVKESPEEESTHKGVATNMKYQHVSCR